MSFFLEQSGELIYCHFGRVHPLDFVKNVLDHSLTLRYTQYYVREIDIDIRRLL